MTSQLQRTFYACFSCSVSVPMLFRPKQTHMFPRPGSKTYLLLQTVLAVPGQCWGDRHPHLSLSFITALTTTQKPFIWCFFPLLGLQFSLFGPPALTLCLSPANIPILIINSSAETVDSTVSPKKANLLS